MTGFMKSILTMTFTGSIVSIFLFAIKPMIKDKLPKSFQYYMWFPVIIALILPLSQIVEMPVPDSAAIPMKSIHDISQWISSTAFEKPINFVSAQQAENEQQILHTTAHFPSIAVIVFIFWQLGMILVLGFNMICYVLFVQRLKKHNISADQQETELLSKLSGSKSTLRLYKNPMAATPILIGIFRPAIILPYKKYEDMELQSIFLHEVTHMRKHDIVVKWSLILVGALHWFNPVIYFVRREINKACELACDESVIRKFDNDGKQHYGDALITVAAGAIQKVPVSIIMFEDKKNLKERLGAIMKHKDFPKRTIYLSGILLAAVICVTFYLGTARSSTDSGNGDTITYADIMRRQKMEKEAEVEQALCDYDKDIIKVWVYLADSDNEFVSANVFVVSEDQITDTDEQDEIKAIVSGRLDLDVQNVSFTNMDIETFTAEESLAEQHTVFW